MNATQLQRCRNLLGVGETLLTPPLTYTLGFDHVDCGTYACFMGHYERKVGPVLPNDEDCIYRFVDDLPVIAEHFGITEREASALFSHNEDESDVPGQAAYDELQIRLDILRGIIARAEAGHAAIPRVRAVA